MYKAIDNEVLICPYNSNHVISSLRFQLHVVKCRQKYSVEKLATCYYNYSHNVKVEDLLKHYEHCPNKLDAYEK